jgi:DNA replicative helicase MCM subunit Mcm2 (Cdc46/Mcm family)
VEGELDVLQLKRYIAYARAKCSPRLNEQVSATECHGLPRIATDCHGLPRIACLLLDLAKCSPRLNAQAREVLQNYYVAVRQGLVQEDAEAERRGRAPRAVPITVRRLKAIVPDGL